MRIEISEQARDAIMKYGGALYIYGYERPACGSCDKRTSACASHGFWTEIGKPGKKHQDTQHEINTGGLNIYIDQSIRTKDVLVIDVSHKLPLMKPTLSVEGIITE